MMSSSPETSTRTTGAHRAQREERDRGAARTLAQRPPARYEPFLDGLFTYCLSVLCDHDTATAALGDVLALAERRGGPDAAGDRRPWLYALARWACLRKLAEAKQKRQATHASSRHGTDRKATEPPVAEDVLEARRRELALLAWPEAAGTTPEQREALELAVRHHLAAHEVAAVLGMDLAGARELLASAACEVERTRAALAVVETGDCPSVARLTGDNQFVLSSALRRELVRHVDDCPRCRRSAERAVPGRWPGAMTTPAELPVLEAPRAALHMALAHHPRARGAGVPRFDRRGFPMDPKDRAARRDRLRARAVTTTVVATVVAAPVLALWAAYRGGPAVEGAGDHSASASEAHGPDSMDGEAASGGYQNAGNASVTPGPRFTKDGRPDVSVEVVSVAGTGGKGAGHLVVGADNNGDTTLITLEATGDAPVRWSARTGASWLYLSHSSGTLKPGETFTIKVYVDHLREPSGPWSARVAISPAGAVVTISGYGTAPTPPTQGTPRPTPPPTDPDPSPTTPAPTPTDPPSSSPTPGPSETDPAPSDPPSQTPSPTASDDPSPSSS
ncbi:sigma-70 family RNA polymerase sigma factor [Streptomyces sp. SID13726]|uniref:sigma-70 family RNA polymerase sigma factor n=1 Tax=Streptomyces sp. SID13726 TaxID=2706058 RepID=UPI0013BB8922|nr:sigma-70 family RNA polymerase sigma factor [Streptomyces sp. SID13726]NEB00760.1 sigma-70 family RNA polymerase sigma factor [Streptomyces sp. SID13726]